MTKELPGRLSWPGWSWARQRWVFLSPHSDDLALSLGGFALAEANQVDILALNIFSRSNHIVAEPMPQDPENVTRVRKAEEISYMDSIGARVEFLDFNEAPLRGTDSDAAARSVKKRVEQAILGFLRRNEDLDALCFPLGIGGNLDHLMVREIVSQLAPTLQAEGMELYAYEDLPYAAVHEPEWQHVLEQIRGNGFSLSLIATDITQVLDEKCRRLELYRSQMASEYADPIRRYALARHGGSHQQAHEALWKTVGPR
jgi:LmbE family N-acetylglucosaminyl deacetylase